MRIALLGLPGSGKSTLAQHLGATFNIMHISSGALARAHGFADSKEEKSGQLDPDEGKIRRLVKEAIGDSTHYILDGFPRMISQVKEIDIRLDAVVYLRLHNEQIGIDRLLKRGRPDDCPSIIEMRISTYYTHTHPLAEYFDKKRMLVDVNASDSIAYTLAQTVIQLGDWGILEANEYLDKLLRLERKADARLEQDQQISKKDTQG